MIMRICPECGKGIDEHFTECPNCGYPFNGKEKHVRGKLCPDCGREIPMEQKECPYCGYDFEQAEQLARIKQKAEEAEEKARLAANKAKAAEEKLRRQKQKQKQEEMQRQLEEYQRKIREAEAQEKAAKERIQKAAAEEKDSINEDWRDKTEKNESFNSFSKKTETSPQKGKKAEKEHKQHDKKSSKKKKRIRNIGIIIACILAFFIVVRAWNKAHPHLIYVIDNEGLIYSVPWNSTEYEVEQKVDDASEKGTWENSTNSHKYVVSSPYFLAISGLNGKISLILHKDKNVMALDNATIEFSAGKDCKASKSDVYQKLKNQYNERFGKSNDGINWETEKSKIKISGFNTKGNNISNIKVHISEKDEKVEQKKEKNATGSQSPKETPKQEQSDSLEAQSESSATSSTSSDESSASSSVSLDQDHTAVVPGSSNDEELGNLLWTNGTVYGIPWYSTYSELPEKVKQWGQIVEYDDLTNYICEDRGTYGGIAGTHVELAMIFGGSPGTAKLDFAFITITKDDTCEYSDDELLQAVLTDLIVRYGKKNDTTPDGTLVWETTSGSSVTVQYDKNHNLSIALGVPKSN